jgi:hypothetical protein
MKLLEAMLQSSSGATIFLGETGIGKTELLKHLVSLPRNHREYAVAYAYVEAWPSMLVTDPFIDSLALALDSIVNLEPIARDKKRLPLYKTAEATSSARVLSGDSTQDARGVKNKRGVVL